MIAAALSVVACSEDPQEDALNSFTPSLTAMPVDSVSPQDGTTWRWVNITVDIKADSDISVARYIASDLEYPPDGGPVLELFLGESYIQLDAQSGEIISQSVGEADNELETTLSSLVVGPKPSVEQLPWPYASGARPEKTTEQGNIRFTFPDPEAGIVLAFGCGDSPYPGEGGCWIEIRNEQSKRAVDTTTGETIETYDNVAQEDKAAFDRWRQAVEIVGQ
jgi:hypothetical protein